MVSTDNLAEAAQVVADIGNLAIRLNWLDRAIEKLYEWIDFNCNIRTLQQL